MVYDGTPYEILWIWFNIYIYMDDLGVPAFEETYKWDLASKRWDVTDKTRQDTMHPYFIRTSIRKYVHTDRQTDIQTYIHPSMHPSVQTNRRACAHACIHMYIRTYVHAYMCTSVRTYKTSIDLDNQFKSLVVCCKSNIFLTSQRHL